MFKTKITKIGGSLGLIIPAIEVDYSDFKEGEWLEVKILRIEEKVAENEAMALSGKDKEEDKDELDTNSTESKERK